MGIKDQYHMIGLMSGTSLDGLDIAYCHFSYSQHWAFKLLKAKTVEFPNDLVNQLQNSTGLPGLELKILDINLGAWLGKTTAEFIKTNRLKVDAIASHGHTVFHQPENKLTLQIGSLPALFSETDIPVIGDFRSLDIALGGQGAPLVPIGDLLLFGEYEFCLNLGGMSNISFDFEGQRIAFDICPVNTVLNKLASERGLPFDRDGQISSQGKVNSELLQRFNDLDYYQTFKPKSLGIEWVNKHVFPLFEYSNIPLEDKMNTFVHHIATQIAKSINHYRGNNSTAKILITGGGAFNAYLVDTIKKHLEGITCVVPDNETVSYKEAIVFAFMGVLKLRNEVNVLSSVTGASKNSCSGMLVENGIF